MKVDEISCNTGSCLNKLKFRTNLVVLKRNWKKLSSLMELRIMGMVFLGGPIFEIILHPSVDIGIVIFDTYEARK